LWVWGIFALLTVLGLSMLRARPVSAARLSILPAVMIVYSLFSVIAIFGARAQVLLAWLANSLYFD
jgi:hypothetical protein